MGGRRAVKYNIDISQFIRYDAVVEHLLFAYFHREQGILSQVGVLGGEGGRFADTRPVCMTFMVAPPSPTFGVLAVQFSFICFFL